MTGEIRILILNSRKILETEINNFFIDTVFNLRVFADEKIINSVDNPHLVIVGDFSKKISATELISQLKKIHRSSRIFVFTENAPPNLL